jgi:hypothetical protein
MLNARQSTAICQKMAFYQATPKQQKPGTDEKKRKATINNPAVIRDSGLRDFPCGKRKTVY